VGLGPRLPRQAHAQPQTRLLLRRRAGEELRTVDGAAPNDLNPPTDPKHKPPKYISETDPQAAWSLKDGPGRFSYEVNYLADDKHAIIVDVAATPARLRQEIVAAKEMLSPS